MMMPRSSLSRFSAMPGRSDVTKSWNSVLIRLGLETMFTATARTFDSVLADACHEGSVECITRLSDIHKPWMLASVSGESELAKSRHCALRRPDSFTMFLTLL